ncbi:LexA family transcriptional repressor, partial [Klebsiella pneumoniae]|nr:LexA family transcriptional repressor [Klebsiella pneumoniae]
GRGEETPDDTKVIPFLKPPTAVPIISAVQAGMWTDTYACSRLSDVISWTQTTANVSNEAFGLVVRGESM